MVSLKQYADSSKVTYEAVRKQVARYKKELGEHLIQDGRQFFLDDYAVSFLDEKRRKNPVVIQTENKDERIVELEKALNDLRERLTFREAELQGEITKAEREAKKAYQELSEKSNLIASAEYNLLLLEDKRNELQVIKKQYEEQGELLQEYKFMKKEQNDQIMELRQKQEEKDRIIEEYRKKETSEISKSKWQKFLDIWK